MATLHLVYEAAALDSCLECASIEDTVLLMENGVYAAVNDTRVPLRVLREDLEARGLEGRLARNAVPISYDQLVELVVEHQPIVSWC